MTALLCLASLLLLSVHSFVPPAHHHPKRRCAVFLRDTIVSPFEGDADSNESSSSSVTTTADKGPLDLTYENVELVLDEMRPYLIQDGGNVVISEIDGPVVKLELQVRPA